MTAEQLEGLLDVCGSSTEARADAEFQLKQLGPSLARRVLAAENLAEAVEYDLSCWPDTMASSLRQALAAYREASK